MIAPQDIALLAARLSMATMFFVSAGDKFRLDPMEVQQVASLHLPVPKGVLFLTGILEALGGLAVIAGVYARLAGLALALFTLFVSLAFLRFWRFPGPPEVRAMMRNTLVGNIAIIGGLIYLTVFGPGALALTNH